MHPFRTLPVAASLASIAAAAVGATPAVACAQGGATTRTVLERAVGAYNNPDLLLTARELTIAPGARGTSHRHPGIVAVYVIAGSVEVILEHAPPHVYHAGEAFSELPGQLHVSTRNPSATEPARLLSVIIGRRGDPLTRREPPPPPDGRGSRSGAPDAEHPAHDADPGVEGVSRVSSEIRVRVETRDSTALVEV